MKSEILHLLRNADGYISGQQLCEAFGVSRTAVWKAINQLKEEGYVIDSVQNKGYRITEYPDIITDTEIRSLLIKDSAIKSRADKEQDRKAGNKDRNVSTDKESYNKLKDNSSDDNKLEGIFQHIRYFEKTDSTNNQAKLAAESNARRNIICCGMSDRRQGTKRKKLGVTCGNRNMDEPSASSGYEPGECFNAYTCSCDSNGRGYKGRG